MEHHFSPLLVTASEKINARCACESRAVGAMTTRLTGATTGRALSSLLASSARCTSLVTLDAPSLAALVCIGKVD